MSGRLKTRKALTKGREGWTAKICGVFPNVIGDLYDEEGRKFRSNFQVTAKEDGTFFVDIGTGSGVKIKFKF